MRIFLNSASFIGQAASLHHGGQLLQTMMEALERLKEISVPKHELYQDMSIRGKTVVAGHSFKQVVDFRQKQVADEQAAKAERNGDISPERERFTRFINDLTKQPLASEVFGDEVFECLHQDADVSYQALGYAAHFTKEVFEGTGATAVVLSLAECPTYAESRLVVLYGVERKRREVWNVSLRAHVDAEHRTFERNPKHDRAHVVDGVKVAAMDLTDEEAQKLLHSAVALPKERRLFARHKGRIYIFPCNYPDKHVYHGYPVEPPEMMARMADIRAQLLNHFDWEELR